MPISTTATSKLLIREFVAILGLRNDKEKKTSSEELAFLIGSGGWIRTNDRPINSRMLYH